MSRYQWRGFSVIFGGFLFTFSSLSIYVVGNTINYIESYLVFKNKEIILPGEAIYIGAITLATAGLFSYPVCKLASMLSLRLGGLFATLTMTLGIYLTATVLDHGHIFVILIYSLLGHVGYSLVYVIPTSCGIQWFPKHAGLVNGFILCGMGLGALLMGSIASEFVDPKGEAILKNGYFTNPEILKNIPSLFIFLGSIMLPLQIISLLLMTEKPKEEINSNPTADTPIVLKNLNDSYSTLNSNHDNLIEVKTKSLFFKKEFYILWLIFCMDSVPYIIFTSIFKNMGLFYYSNDQLISTLDGLSAVFSVCGRITTGFLCDIYSYKSLMMFQCFISILLLLTLDIVARVNFYMFGTWIAGLYFLMGRTLIMTPVVTSQVFGTKYFVTNYAMLFTQFVFSSSISIIISIKLIKGEDNDWYYLYIATAICTAIAGILSILMPRNPKELRKC